MVASATLATVTMPVATANLFTLNEGGFFAGYGGGAGSIVLGAVITDNGGNPIVGATGTVAPPIPFFAPLPSPQVLLDWTGTLNAVAPTALLTYTVHLDNDLTSSAPAQRQGEVVQTWMKCCPTGCWWYIV